MSFGQLVELGYVPWRVRELARREKWERVLPGVYAIGQASDEWRQRVMAACLWVGKAAVASHLSAARLYGLDGIEATRGGKEAPPRDTPPVRTAKEVHVSVPRSRAPRKEGILVHRVRGIEPGSKTLRDGIPCTTLVRTVVDLAGLLPELELAMAVESAWRADSELLDRLERWLKTRGQGLQGVLRLRRVLADCAERSHKPMDSALEVRFWYWLKSSGLPLANPQYPYAGHGDYVRFVDFAYLDQRLAIETDGFEFHRSREQFEQDAAKLSYLAANGWRVLHVTWRMLERSAAELKRWIALALELPPPSGHARSP